MSLAWAHDAVWPEEVRKHSNARASPTAILSLISDFYCETRIDTLCVTAHCWRHSACQADDVPSSADAVGATVQTRDLGKGRIELQLVSRLRVCLEVGGGGGRDDAGAALAKYTRSEPYLPPLLRIHFFPSLC